MLAKLIPYLSGGAAMAFINAAVSSLEAPTAANSAFYKWFFRFSHVIVLNFSRLSATWDDAKYPPPDPPPASKTVL